MTAELPGILNSLPKIGIAAIGSVMIMATMLMLGVEQGFVILIATLLALYFILSLTTLRFWMKLKNAYNSEKPIIMLLHVKELDAGDYSQIFAELRKPDNTDVGFDIEFRIRRTEWLAQLEQIEKVKVYGDYQLHGFLIETRLGLIWPNMPKFFSRSEKINLR